MKKIISVIVIVAVIAAGVFIGPKVVHKCDSCGKVFVGAGYEPNVVEDFLADEDQIICKDCAAEQHGLSLAMGKTLDDFKLDIF